jgi:hypothetical protein
MGASRRTSVRTVPASPLRRPSCRGKGKVRDRSSPPLGTPGEYKSKAAPVASAESASGKSSYGKVLTFKK